MDNQKPSRFIRKLHPFIEQYPPEKKDKKDLTIATDAARSLQPGKINEDKTKENTLRKMKILLYRIDETLHPSQGASKYIHDFVHSKNPKLANQTKTKRIKMALAAYYAAKREKAGLKKINESTTVETLHDTIEEFISFASAYLNLSKVPPIKFTESIDKTTFATYHTENGITIAVANRHPMDVFRSLAHELVHHKQNEEERLHSESGVTGSEHENEANSLAGIIMRDFAKINPEYFELESIHENISKPIKGRTRWFSSRVSSLGKGKKAKVGFGFIKRLFRVGKKKTTSRSTPLDRDLEHQRRLELIRAKGEEARKTLHAKTKLTKTNKINDAHKEKKISIDNADEYAKHKKAHDKWNDALKKSVTLDDTIGVFNGKTITKRKYYTDARDYHAEKMRSLSEKEIFSLLKKSRAYSIPYEVLLEVYHRGLDDWKNQKTKLTSEQYAFNRINSFIAGGKAAEIDKDLFEEVTE